MGSTKTLKIAFYGKGGIGKSTIASNLSAAFSVMGLKILHIGCDPKEDSTRNLTGKKINSFLKALKIKGNNILESDVIFKGFNGISCIEAGGPEAGSGCAGLGITTMMEELERLGVMEKTWDVIIYDVLGDVVCGGFAVPMRKKAVDSVYIVSSSEFMSLYAANNIVKGINNFSDGDNTILSGIIHNTRNIYSSPDILKKFAQKAKAFFVSDVPFSKKIVLSELEKKTVIEKFPDSKESQFFINLASLIIKNTNSKINPVPLDDDELERFALEISDELKNIEYGNE